MWYATLFMTFRWLISVNILVWEISEFDDHVGIYSPPPLEIVVRTLLFLWRLIAAVILLLFIYRMIKTNVQLVFVLLFALIDLLVSPRKPLMLFIAVRRRVVHARIHAVLSENCLTLSPFFGDQYRLVDARKVFVRRVFCVLNWYRFLLYQWTPWVHQLVIHRLLYLRFEVQLTQVFTVNH